MPETLHQKTTKVIQIGVKKLPDKTPPEFHRKCFTSISEGSYEVTRCNQSFPPETDQINISDGEKTSNLQVLDMFFFFQVENLDICRLRRTFMANPEQKYVFSDEKRRFNSDEFDRVCFRLRPGNPVFFSVFQLGEVSQNIHKHPLMISWTPATLLNESRRIGCDCRS